MSHRFFCLDIPISVAVLLAGCGKEVGPGRVPLQGTVHVDGVRIESGSITLLPLPGHSGPAATTPIVDGSYAFTPATGPVPGPHRAVVGIAPPDDDPRTDAGGAIGEATADADIKTAPQAARGRGGAAGPAAATQWELQLEVPAKGDYRADLNFGTN